LKKNKLIVSFLSVIATVAVTACASVQPVGPPPASLAPGQTAPATPSAESINPTSLDQPIILPSPVGDIDPTPANAAAWDQLRQQVWETQAVAEMITTAFPPNRPEDYMVLSTFYRPHALAGSEKEQVLAIASAWQPLRQALENPAILKMEVRDYLWKSFSNEGAVTVSDTLVAARGTSQKLLDYLGFDVLPGVYILFHTSRDSYAYATVKIVVGPAAGKVIWTEASVTAAQPPTAGGWDNVNPESFRLDFHDSTQNPLSPNYDPNSIYGPEGTRFGPPWDRSAGLAGGASPTGPMMNTPTPSAANASLFMVDYSTLIDSLRATGADVVEKGPISQRFFSVQGQSVEVNGALMQVFEYPTNEAAETDSKAVRPDGYAFTSGGRIMMFVEWIAPPHFFLSGSMIVIYVGQDESVLNLLKDKLGPQFAGR
jgi:hypothetical protein